MGYYSDNSSGYEGRENLLTLRQLIAGEGGNANHEAIFSYLMGHTYGPSYKSRRAGQAFLLLAPPIARILGAWDSYIWELEYGKKEGVKGTPTPPISIVSMLNAVDGVKLSPYMLSILSTGIQPLDHIHLGSTAVYGTPVWVTYRDVAESDDRSLCLNYITRELGYSTQGSTAIHNLILGNLYV